MTGSGLVSCVENGDIGRAVLESGGSPAEWRFEWVKTAPRKRLRGGLVAVIGLLAF